MKHMVVLADPYHPKTTFNKMKNKTGKARIYKCLEPYKENVNQSDPPTKHCGLDLLAEGAI